MMMMVMVMCGAESGVVSIPGEESIHCMHTGGARLPQPLPFFRVLRESATFGWPLKALEYSEVEEISNTAALLTISSKEDVSSNGKLLSFKIASAKVSVMLMVLYYSHFISRFGLIADSPWYLGVESERADAGLDGRVRYISLL